MRPMYRRAGRFALKDFLPRPLPANSPRLLKPSRCPASFLNREGPTRGPTVLYPARVENPSLQQGGAPALLGGKSTPDSKDDAPPPGAAKRPKAAQEEMPEAMRGVDVAALDEAQLGPILEKSFLAKTDPLP